MPHFGNCPWLRFCSPLERGISDRQVISRGGRCSEVIRASPGTGALNHKGRRVSRRKCKDRLPWGKYIAAMAAYAACYELTRHCSVSYWMLYAGLRLSCLLLLPRRFWTPIAIGEALPVVTNALICIRDLGVLTTIFGSSPIIVLCMPVVMAFRRHMRLFQPGGEVNMTMIVGCTLACSVITAVVIDMAFVAYLLHAANEKSTPFSISPAIPLLLVYFLGAFQGALTLTPSVLALRERFKCKEFSVRGVLRCSLTRDLAFGAVPILAAMVLLAQVSSGGTLMLARLSMAIPVFVLTLRHGWHGGAFGGLLASFAIAMTATIVREPGMIQAQAVMAVALSTCLLFGQKAVAARNADMPARAYRRRHGGV